MVKAMTGGQQGFDSPSDDVGVCKLSKSSCLGVVSLFSSLHFGGGVLNIKQCRQYCSGDFDGGIVPRIRTRPRFA